jgi:hypothetical protein
MMFDNQRGQVGVVVAILMVTLLVAVIVIIQVYYVPSWMKEKESDHMDIVGNQFSNLKFSIDLQTLAQLDVPITNSITLGSKELPYFISSRAFGSLNVLPPSNSNFSILITADGKMERANHTTSGLSSNTIENITSLIKFELQLSSLNDKDTFNVSLEGNPAIMVTIHKNISVGYRITLVTFNEGSVIFNQTIAAALPNEAYTINLLDNMYKFNSHIVATAESPYNISYNGTANGVFTVSCYKYIQDDEDIQYELGSIEYQSENAYFVDQTYIYQGGAIVVGQADGEAIFSPPFFTATNTTTQHVINASVVDVLGLSGKRGASGYGTYAIRTNYSDTENIKFIAENITLNITTDYLTAWERYLNSTLNATGMQHGQDYVINMNSTRHELRVTLYGPNRYGKETDLLFYLSKNSIYAQVGPGWVS